MSPCGFPSRRGSARAMSKRWFAFWRRRRTRARPCCPTWTNCGSTTRAGSVECYKIALERRWQFVTYPKVTYWVEVESKRPFKSEFMSTNDLILKTAFYKDYKPALGRDRPSEIVIVDALQKNHFTRMIYSG